MHNLVSIQWLYYIIERITRGNFNLKRKFCNFFVVFALLLSIFNFAHKKADCNNAIGFHTILAMTYSPKKRILSTIGAEGLNCCVRDGNRCDSFAIITRISGNYSCLSIYLRVSLKTIQWSLNVQPLSLQSVFYFLLFVEFYA